MESGNSRLVLVAAASAAAGSLVTLAALRMKHGRQRAAQNEPRELLSATDQLFNGDLVPLAARKDPFDPNPRTGYLSWDDYFMAVAFLSAQRSKDPSKQVGACIVNESKVICGIGYNGFPRGCPDRALPWAKRSAAGDPLQTKYPYVCHAEMNAILNKNGASVAGARVYVTMFPCNECAKLMIQAGISEVVYHEAKEGGARSDSTTTSAGFNRDQQYAASRRLLALAGVKLRQHLFRRPVLLRLTNSAEAPAVVESAGAAGSAAAAAEIGAAAAAPAVAPAVAAVLENANGSRTAAAAAAAAESAESAEGAAANGGAASKRRRRKQRQPAGVPDAAALPQPQAIGVAVHA